MKDAKDQGKEAVEILREHHLGKSKPRIKMAATECVTDYNLRRELLLSSFLI